MFPTCVVVRLSHDDSRAFGDLSLPCVAKKKIKRLWSKGVGEHHPPDPGSLSFPPNISDVFVWTCEGLWEFLPAVNSSDHRVLIPLMSCSPASRYPQVVTSHEINACVNKCLWFACIPASCFSHKSQPEHIRQSTDWKEKKKCCSNQSNPKSAAFSRYSGKIYFGKINRTRSSCTKHAAAPMEDVNR